MTGPTRLGASLPTHDSGTALAAVLAQHGPVRLTLTQLDAAEHLHLRWAVDQDTGDRLLSAHDPEAERRTRRLTAVREALTAAGIPPRAREQLAPALLDALDAEDRP